MPADRELSCDQIEQARDAVTASMKQAIGKIEANRTQNRVAAYAGAVFFLPLLLATEGNKAEREEIDRLYERRDSLAKLSVLRKC